MRRKCHTCLCRTCLNTCCDRKECPGKKTECKRYSGFRQMSIFESSPEPKYQKAPRYSWEHYGITKERYRQLTEYIQSGRYAPLASQAAHTANEDLERYIILSFEENISYDTFQKKWELGEMEQIPYCRTDFYGYRRLFMHLLDLELRRIGK